MGDQSPNGKHTRIKIKATMEEIAEVAAVGASWKDLASLIGCSDRTLRSWRAMRDRSAHEIFFPPGPPDPAAAIIAKANADEILRLQASLAGIAVDDLPSPPPPPEAAEIPPEVFEVLAAIELGWARGKRRILDKLSERAQEGDIKASIYLLERLEKLSDSDL